MDQKINRVLLPDIKYSDESGEHTFTYNGGASPLEQAITAFKTNENGGKSLFLTAVGGQGKTTTLRTLWLDFLRGKNNIPCIYVDCKLLKIGDGDHAITERIKSNYSIDILWSELKQKPIILLDGANELVRGLREKENDEDSCFIQECKSLIEQNCRLIIASRTDEINEKSEVDLEHVSEFSGNKIQYLELCALSDDCLKSVLNSANYSVPKESALYHLLKNNMMLSIYLNLKAEYKIDIDPDKMSAGTLLDLYFRICIKTRFVGNCLEFKKRKSDADLYNEIVEIENSSKKFFSDEESRINGALLKFDKVLSTLEGYLSDSENGILGKRVDFVKGWLECSPISYSQLETDLGSGLNFLMPYLEPYSLDIETINYLSIFYVNTDGNYVWGNEIYQEYFEAVHLSKLINEFLEDGNDKTFKELMCGISIHLIRKESAVLRNNYLEHYYNILRYSGELLQLTPEKADIIMCKLNPYYIRLRNGEFNDVIYALLDLLDLRLHLRSYLVHQNVFNELITQSEGKRKSIVSDWLIVMAGLVCEQIPFESLCIPSFAFNECSTLKKIDLKSQEKYFKIYEGAFRECKNLKEVNFADGLREIGEKAFDGCCSLEKIKLQNEIIAIEKNAFDCCKKLKNVDFGEKLRFIYGGAFKECHSLEAIKFPDSLEVIGESAFLECKSLEKVELGKGLRIIEDNAFMSCRSIKKIRIFDELECIGKSAFGACDSLIEVKFDESKRLQVIGEKAFWYCFSLEEIYLPESLEQISESAFIRCDNLKVIKIPKKTIIYEALNRHYKKRAESDEFIYCNAKVERY